MMHKTKDAVHWDCFDYNYPLCPYRGEDLITCEIVDTCTKPCGGVILLQLDIPEEKDKA